MKARGELHPDVLFERLLERSQREDRRRNLHLIQKICKAQCESSKDLSLRTIGKLCEAAGGLGARTLYNKPSEDYRALIQSWVVHSGKEGGTHKARALDPFEERLLRCVNDSALRTLIQQGFKDLKVARAELNMLKSVSVFSIDRRPQRTTPQPPAMDKELLPSEREALAAAIRPEFLKDQGWSEGRDGQIRTSTGRTLFQAGFAKAIRKVTGD